MLNIGLPACLALYRPRPGEDDTAAVQPLIQTFTEYGEDLAAWIITDICEAPVDREMGNQGEADRFCKLDRRDDVGGLQERDVFGAAHTVAPMTILMLLIGLRCTSA
jgi:hypothetical protein